MKRIAKILAVGIIAAGALTLAGCSQADVASRNLSQDADSFKIHRDIIFHDDLTDTNIARVTGLCSLGNDDTLPERTVTCKIGKDTYVKEIFDMGDNTSVSSIQTEASKTDPFAYEIIFKPTGINLQLQTPGQ
jgi:hypothetical protein